MHYYVEDSVRNAIFGEKPRFALISKLTFKMTNSF